MMKKNIISSCFTFAISLAMTLLASCANDNDEACYFKMETEQTQVNVPAAGISKSKLAKVVIRSNKDWNIQLENPDDAQWVHLFANEGSADGIFRFWVDKNTEFTSRSARLFFTVDGQKQDVPYTIEQAADVPTIAIANAENNNQMNPENLYVAECYANKGPTMKRVKPRAQGRAYRIEKRMSHITIVLDER